MVYTYEEELFLRELQDLKKIAASKDWHELLRVSAVIRKLLIDGSPLVDQVNKRFRLRIQFETALYSLPDPPLKLYVALDGLDPEDSPMEGAWGVGRELTGRDKFLKKVVIVLDDLPITVLDVIRYEAHVSGGVHSGAPGSVEEKALKGLAQVLTVHGKQPSLESMRPMARVVLRGLDPLRAAVEGDVSWVSLVRAARRCLSQDRSDGDVQGFVNFPVSYSFWEGRAEAFTAEEAEVLGSALRSLSKFDEAIPWIERGAEGQAREGRTWRDILGRLGKAFCLLKLARAEEAIRSLELAAIKQSGPLTGYFDAKSVATSWTVCARLCRELGKVSHAKWCEDRAGDMLAHASA
jgi:hypothetical protein